MHENKINLLIVEDNPIDALLIKEELNKEKRGSFKISHVENLSKAKERLAGEKFHITLLDLGLPESTGLETFLKFREAAADMPVIVLSGRDDDIALAAVGMGAQDYLVKGKWDAGLLVRAINYAIERHRLLTELRQAERSLRHSEERFRAVFEGAQDCIFIKDHNLKYVLVNPAVEKVFGVSAPQVIGRTYQEVFGEEGAERQQDVDLRVLRGELVEEEHSRRINGAAVILHEISVPLRNNAGEIIGLCNITRDVTDRKTTEFFLPKMTEEYPSKTMRSVLMKAKIAAGGNSTILLLGESGSGKDYLARYIHNHSKRADGPYFSINCAAVAPEIAESELFGHERGAFTGALGRKRGLLELAEGGTLLLNEIGDLSLPLQAKLLTFLDTRQFTRVGGERNISVNAALIAATNKDLEKEVELGNFRMDLFYRLNVMSIELPPLRERREDIPNLVKEILEKLRNELQLPAIPSVDVAAMSTLQKYHWPGNVRELRNVLERALILSAGKSVDLAALGFQGSDMALHMNSKESSLTISFPSEKSVNELTQDVKKFLVHEALRYSGGSRQGAAKLLKISRYSLKHYMKSLGLDYD